MEKNKYQNERSKIGNFMYNLLLNGSKFLIKYQFLYWFLNFTWGIITTLCGLLISLVLLCFGKKPKKCHKIWYFKIFKNWGGMEMGTMFLRDCNSDNSINNHEYGHTFQNAILGPFFIFIVAIPSAIRYWYQTIREKQNKENKDYDLIWFEGSATDIGNEAEKYFNEKEGDK